jgi:N-acetyl-gamma-glutamyl-phosphate reductase
VSSSAVIVGASGYAGQEVLDRVLAHPELELAALGSDSLAGQAATALDPRLARAHAAPLPAFVPNAEALGAGADVVFLCLGHEEAAAVEPPGDAVVVDLSGAHRLADRALYAAWYGWEHPAPASLAAWEYGLPEVSPPRGRLIANPGCYATAILLALAPLRDAIDPAAVLVDAKSGVSGAGREATQTTHFVSVTENVQAYKVEGHRHAAELEQELPDGTRYTFVPHLIPIEQGLLASCYVTTGLDQDATLDLYQAAYADEPFIDLADEPPGTDDVRETIDNLWKGAAGQAVQDLNLMLGLPETEGLE